MLHPLKSAACLSLLAVSLQVHAGATKITFADTGHAAGEEWPMMAGFWHVRAQLIDASLKPIGNLSEETTFNTASAPSFPTGVQVVLDAPAPANASLVVYRSSSPITEGSNVDQAIYANLCNPSGCAAGTVDVPAAGPTQGELLNTDFRPNGTALPVKLQSFSID